MAELLLVIDLQGNLLEANQPVIDLLGYSRDELFSTNILTLVPPVHHQKALTFINQIIEVGAQKQLVEIKLRNEAGNAVEMEVNGSLLYQNGVPHAIQMMARDITERRRIEDALMASESKYRRLFETAQDGILILDQANGKVTDANPFILGLTEYSLDEIIGKQLWELGFIEDKELSRKAFKILKKEGFIRYEDIPLRTKNGKLLNVEFVSNTYQVTGTGIIQCNIRDITDRKKAEKSLLAVNNKLNILASITRHDILNQITIVLGYLELQKNATSEEAKRELLGKAERAVLEIQRQIEFTRDYQQMGTAEPAWQNLSEVILKLPSAKEIKSLQLADCLNTTIIYADPMLGKVFLNLITNSIKHGGGVSEIRINCLDLRDALLIVYEDNGKGIEAGHKDMIFEKGFGKNSGLGLFLSREILAITGITIRENGKPGKGARFELTVPRGAFQAIP